MARKADEDLLAQLELLGADDAPSTTPTQTPTTQSTPGPAKPASAEDDDVLADLQAQLAVKPSSSGSRPTTPRLSSSTTSGTTKSRLEQHTPASSGPTSARNSEDRLRNVQRTSGEGRSYHQSTTPGQEEAQAVAGNAETESGGGGGGGGWWGSMFSAASAAVKQAESLAKEIGGNEEAQRWAQQVRGNFKDLQSLSTSLSCTMRCSWLLLM